jgi:mannose-6-phosphate isomerase-like protein (cupin superfamily)
MAHAKRVISIHEGADYRDMGGLIKRLVHPSTVGSKNIGVSMAFLHPGEKVRRHRHDSEEVYVVVSGEGTMFLEGHPEITLKKNVCVYIPSNAEHGQTCTGDEPLVLVAALAPPLTVPPTFTEPPN